MFTVQVESSQFISFALKSRTISVVALVLLACAGCDSSSKSARKSTRKPISKPTKVKEIVAPPGSTPLAVDFSTASLEANRQAWAGVAEHGKSFSNELEIQFLLIPSGSFVSSESEGNKASNGEVRVDQPFYLACHEVTVGQFRAFVDESSFDQQQETGSTNESSGGYYWDPETNEISGPDENIGWQNPGWEQTEDHPVVNVSFQDAEKFIAWMSKKDGRSYRLPTEAEWEYVCRAGTTTMYYSGDEEQSVTSCGNVADRSAKEQFPRWDTLESDDGFAFTAPVGSFPANTFGIYDMHGNVFELCADWYEADFIPKGIVKVMRGGSWGSGAWKATSGFREGVATQRRTPFLGFRLAANFEPATD